MSWKSWMASLRALASKSVKPSKPQPATWRQRRARLGLESLEHREVLSVTPLGGPVLPNVEVQPLYYGTNAQQTQFNNFLGNIVQSSYMDMLTNAGYGVGRGSFSAGVNYLTKPGSTITDANIQAAIQTSIKANFLAAPDANRLYIVYVQPNVEVIGPDGRSNSVQNFAGYHYTFKGTNAQGQSATIHYAVIPTPGGTVGNASNNRNLNTFDEMTEVTTHELAEAVTDPNVGLNQLSWVDTTYRNFQGNLGAEIGDIANGQTVYLNGYAVQRIADKLEQPMTPAGATAVKPVNFVLTSNGSLYESSSSGLLYLTGGVASISDQGIDNNGIAMIDVVFTNGSAQEYRDWWGFNIITQQAQNTIGVKSARAGQGVSYLLLNDGTVWEYKDVDSSLTQIATGATSIDAGTTREGVNMVAYTDQWTDGFTRDDTKLVRVLSSGIKTVSLGQQGNMAVLHTDGTAYWHLDGTTSYTYLYSNIAQMTIGTDVKGNWVIDAVNSDGELWQYGPNSGWTELWSGVQAVSKSHAGVVSEINSSGDAYDYGPNGWTYLAGSVKQVV